MKPPTHQNNKFGSSGMNSSAYFLERVGFEPNFRLRLNLKNGTNTIGRTHSKDRNDFGIDSGRCSALHCILTVAGDNVEIVNKSVSLLALQVLNSGVGLKNVEEPLFGEMKKTVGTTVNDLKLTDDAMQLHENDVIGIVRGATMSLAGNYSLFVYRLRKYDSENPLIIEIDDDETYEVSDDDGANNNEIIILDPIDIKVEEDMRIQLSRGFNNQIKRELRDLDEYEAHCTAVKSEQSNFFEIETPDDYPAEDDIATFDPHREERDEYNGDEFICDAIRCGSNESSDTVIFSPPQDVHRSDENGSVGADATMEVDETAEADVTVGNGTVDAGDELERALAKIVNQEEDINRGTGNAHPTQNGTAENVKSIKKDERTGTKSGEKSKRQKLVKETPTQKKHKKVENKKEKRKTDADTESRSRRHRQAKKSKESTKKNEKPSSSKGTEVPEKTRTKAKVKYTKDNRGAFLTDPTQIPGLPPPVKERRKSTIMTPVPMVSLLSSIPLNPNKENEISDTDDILPELNFRNDDALYATFRAKKLSFNDLRRPDPNLTGGPSVNSPLDNEITLPDRSEYEPIITDGPSLPTNMRIVRREPIVHQPSHEIEVPSFSTNMRIVRKEPIVHQPSHEIEVPSLPKNMRIVQKDPIVQQPNRENEGPSLPTNMRIVHNDSIVRQPSREVEMSNGKREENQLKRKKAVKEGSGFQINPCHEVISILTSYDSEQFKTVDAFCRSIDLNVNAFGDTFNNFAEYQGSILPLLMLELWKEMELEYINSESNDFLTVAVTDKNLEKRGEGSRMVFHCQVDSSPSSQSLCDGHIVFARCECNRKKIEFLAMITHISKAGDRLAHFTMETSAPIETLPMRSVEIRAITVVSNTLNAFRSIYSLCDSPLLKLVLNPLSGQLPSKQLTAGEIVYKGYDKLDAAQMSALKAIYRQCIELSTPTISLLDGAAGTGKSCLISNLALQLVYGNGLPKPLRILICSRSNMNIDEITKKLVHIRNRTCSVQKIQLVRFGLLEQIDVACRCVSVQYMKEHDQRFIQLANVDNLEKEKKTLELKIRALILDDENDNSAELKLWKSKLIKVNTLIGRLVAMDKNKLNDATTVLLNACDIICTTLGSVPKLRHYLPNVDVCIIDEATQCNESLTLLPLRFGMSSLVLVGDSRLPPPSVISAVANEKNYGKSLFSRIQKSFSGKPDSPIFRINIQHRMHPEILKWPNAYFYNNRLHPLTTAMNSFPIVPYKIISYSPVPIESDNVLLLVNALLDHVDPKKYSIGIICTSSQQKFTMQNSLRDHPISINSADDSHLIEKDVTIIWISKEYGMRLLGNHPTLFNRAVTRARQSLLICGADLLAYKSRPIWKSIQEDAQARKQYIHLKNFTRSKIVNVLKKKV